MPLHYDIFKFLLLLCFKHSSALYLHRDCVGTCFNAYYNSKWIYISNYQKLKKNYSAFIILLNIAIYYIKISQEKTLQQCICTLGDSHFKKSIV